ncbi:MAG TPA: hypothetical protein PKC18_02870 [Lacipirellulaceae bacterium]|nr:hypothetical protein [Lacipirellulaceae bacterium]HMP06817.1 hypothetical protein [Lacipirellulaceae bacterium]
MKGESRIPQLPSLGELIEHPRVRGFVDRVNRTTLAQRASGLLDEIRSSLASRVGRLEPPTVNQLAERLARRLLGELTVRGPVANATGVVLSDGALSGPLAEQALLAMFRVAGDYHRCVAPHRDSIDREIASLVGAEGVCLSSHLLGASTLALAGLAGDRSAVVFGSTSCDGPLDWRWIAARGGVTLSVAPRQQGIADERWDISFAGSENAAAIVRYDEADGENVLKALASLRKAVPNAHLIDVAPVAGVLDPVAYGYQSIPTIAQRLEAGADLVVSDGAALLGGPPCGVLAGQSACVERLKRHPLASLVNVSSAALAAWEAVLNLYRDDGETPAAYQIPVWQLLSAPAVNLQQRAERMASLVAASPQASSATARQVESAWRRWGGFQWNAPSWVVDIVPAAGDAGSLAREIAKGAMPVEARHDGDHLYLDLRSVFPRWDQALVATVESALGGAATPSAIPSGMTS